MNTKLYVGNLSFDATENDIQDMFAACGPVQEVNLIVDRMTNRSRGFAFVTMATPEGAQAAITQLGGKNINGRDLTVNEARPREAGGGGGGGGRGFSGGGGGGGGGRRDHGDRQQSRRY
jgi:RNA recognition motif-containing protein